jgi:hypothetical protein
MDRAKPFDTVLRSARQAINISAAEISCASEEMSMDGSRLPESCYDLRRLPAASDGDDGHDDDAGSDQAHSGAEA